ncbi:P-loop containing nucleoside triphosphate hydrolase protein [Cladorrhinum samala]|uniref:P-loop containing nucleoside triphosphate hydrolase protein n=1 Tax=Cladorrhinum samala TaxID=585594 RepID=A0AAV9HEQ8_9PEZI|nr:P-loop containing nucleoside triphosphate hydrolase protein [Cladorrhinum samala]
MPARVAPSNPTEPTNVQPIYSFPTVDEFARRHKAGTKAEFAADEKVVHDLNRKNLPYTAWVLAKLRQTRKRSEFFILVRPHADARLPAIGEIAKLRIVLGDDAQTRFWDARRVENPAGLFGVRAIDAAKLGAFVITVPNSDAHEALQPLSSAAHVDLELSSENAVHVNFMLIASEATKDSELGALELLHGPHANCTERQEHAFRWFVKLRDPEFFVDLHDALPHIRATLRQSSFANSKLGKMYASLNQQQKSAFLDGFRKMPCGICVLPGGPGAGKTHFNLFTIAMAQLHPMPGRNKRKTHQPERSAKVLFIVDMNSPVDDAANRMVRLYEDLGMAKQVIRMKGWGAEVKLSHKLNEAEDAAAAHGDVITVDFTNSFIRTIKAMALGPTVAAERSSRAPTLDEAAWRRYERYKATQYQEIDTFLATELWETDEVIPLRFRRLVYNLYRDTLAAADFVATTPVAAHNHFKGLFRPDLVYFDEAPHARELCNLIAIANFEPIAWIFCGDYRQTVPYVGSGGPDCENGFAAQMRISMMERAAKANVIKHELLINHRSFGGLHQLASDLFYQKKMTSATDTDTVPLIRMRRYLRNLAGRQCCKVPRLVVSINECQKAKMDGTSCYNPQHTRWVMNRVHELLADPKFLQARRQELGTILIISPYKRAYEQYKKEIKKLPRWARERVEARTVDVVQGYEADFVFLDFVKEKSTQFLDNPNRLCVAVTRARIGEIILVHPDMPKSSTFRHKNMYLNRMYHWCKLHNQVVTLDDDPEDIAIPMLDPGRPTIADFSEDDIEYVDGVPVEIRSSMSETESGSESVQEFADLKSIARKVSMSSTSGQSQRSCGGHVTGHSALSGPDSFGIEHGKTLQNLGSFFTAE